MSNTTASESPRSHDHPERHGADGLRRAMTAEDWDARYAEQVWSGDPNQALVDEAAGLAPGRAVDIACGEGADAVWLARRGWQVTALDVSQAAVERGRAAAQAAGVDIEWVVAPLVDAALPPGSFDLVTCFYPALPSTPEQVNEHLLADLVAPGGHLVVVHHAEVDVDHAREHGFDPADFVSVAGVASVLGGGWVTRIETRDRQVSGGAGAHHTVDDILHARRAG